ncbi:hypothetical protein GCM10009546_38930 [Actinomadura livida]|uniref:Uncharacterized protein n=1 Tax=Actinomadura livida TaxID=79909 RepID=A0ABN1ERZ6_9ACTN|nr:hypothetical protein GCM10010208_49520 [Actinomadura livida]
MAGTRTVTAFTPKPYGLNSFSGGSGGSSPQKGTGSSGGFGGSSPQKGTGFSGGAASR